MATGKAKCRYEGEREWGAATAQVVSVRRGSITDYFFHDSTYGDVLSRIEVSHRPKKIKYDEDSNAEYVAYSRGRAEIRLSLEDFTRLHSPVSLGKYVFDYVYADSMFSGFYLDGYSLIDSDGDTAIVAEIYA
jgi:hypothetical protein